MDQWLTEIPTEVMVRKIKQPKGRCEYQRARAGETPHKSVFGESKESSGHIKHRNDTEAERGAGDPPNDRSDDKDRFDKARRHSGDFLVSRVTSIGAFF
jgi:hypothetical protein